jgi:hypothetical protein
LSTIENLDFVRLHGLDRFIDLEKQRWACPSCGALLCVHKLACISCGQPRTALVQI